MAKSKKVECIVCNKSESFADNKDITYNKWNILAWDVGTGEPICVCTKCDYPPENKEEENVKPSKKQQRKDGNGSEFFE